MSEMGVMTKFNLTFSVISEKIQSMTGKTVMN